MSIAEELKKEGMEQGRQEGEQKGRQDIAKKMLADGEPINKITRYTGLTEQEILELK